MAIDEAMRFRIHGRFEELLGADEAAALMSVLPLEEMATRADLHRLEERIDRRFDALTTTIELAVERARAETSREARFALLASFGVVAAAASAVLSAIGFFS